MIYWDPKRCACRQSKRLGQKICDECHAWLTWWEKQHV